MGVLISTIMILNSFNYTPDSLSNIIFSAVVGRTNSVLSFTLNLHDNLLHMCVCVCVCISIHRKGFSWQNSAMDVLPDIQASYVVLRKLFGVEKLRLRVIDNHSRGLNWIELNWITLFQVSYVILKLHNSSRLLKVCLNNANRPKLIMITIKIQTLYVTGEIFFI